MDARRFCMVAVSLCAAACAGDATLRSSPPALSSPGAFEELLPPGGAEFIEIGRANNQGYRWRAGEFTWIAVDGATVTVAEGINEHEVVVGRFEDDSGTHAFVWRDGRVIEMFDHPGGPA